MTAYGSFCQSAVLLLLTYTLHLWLLELRELRGPLFARHVLCLILPQEACAQHVCQFS